MLLHCTPVLFQPRRLLKAQFRKGAHAQRLDLVVAPYCALQRVCSMLLIITTALLGAIAVVLYMWKVALEERAAKNLQPAATAATPAADGTSGGTSFDSSMYGESPVSVVALMLCNHVRKSELRSHQFCNGNCLCCVCSMQILFLQQQCRSLQLRRPRQEQ
jgi:hypothetical protein